MSPSRENTRWNWDERLPLLFNEKGQCSNKYQGTGRKNDYLINHEWKDVVIEIYETEKATMRIRNKMHLFEEKWEKWIKYTDHKHSSFFFCSCSFNVDKRGIMFSSNMIYMTYWLFYLSTFELWSMICELLSLLWFFLCVLLWFDVVSLLSLFCIFVLLHILCFGQKAWRPTSTSFLRQAPGETAHVLTLWP